MCPEDRWKEDVNNALFGSEENNHMGLVQQVPITRSMIEEHVKECKESRRELRGWLMSILGAIITAAVLFYLKFA